jgi:hypothetical protein
MATAGLLLGGFASITLASPAQAACASDYRHASTGYSYAEAHTEDCSYQSNSYAQHGGDRIWSGWYTGWSWARADSGFSFSYAAANYFG